MQVNQALMDACQLDTLSILQRFVAAKDEDAMVMTLQLILKEATQGAIGSQKAQPVKVMPLNGGCTHAHMLLEIILCAWQFSA